MARGFFQEALTNAPVLLPKGMTQLSLNELSKLVLRESGQSDPANIEKRAWTQSRLVIHLAAAFDPYGRWAASSSRPVQPGGAGRSSGHRQGGAPS